MAPTEPTHPIGRGTALSRGSMALTAIVVTVAGLVLTELWVRQSVAESETRLQEQFDTLTRRIHSDVDSRFSRSLAPLRSVRSFLMASGEVQRGEFRTYIKTRDLDSEFPGIRGVGLIERVVPQRLAQFEAAQRRDGAPGFEVNASGDHPEHYIVKFIEPLYRNLANVGFDIASEPRRRRAADVAMVTGQPTLTAPITLLQDSKSGAGFLYLLPWYSGEDAVPDTLAKRQQQLRGWVYAPIVVAELMAGSQFDLGGQLRFELYFYASDASQQWLFSSDGLQVSDSSARYRNETEISLGGQSLRLRAFSTPEFEAGIDPQAVAEKRVLGATLSLLLGALAWLVIGARLRALALARRMTRELDRLSTVARYTSNAVIFTDLEERIVWVNEGFTRVSGYSFEEAMGKVPGRLLQSERTDQQARRAIREAIKQRVSCSQVILNTHKDGSDYWLQLEIQPVRDEAGNVSGFVALESDVTSDVESRQALEHSQAIFRGSMDAVNEAYVLFDPQDRLVYCNQKYRDLYARSADLIVPGATFESIIRGGAERGQYRDAVGRVDAWVQERMVAHLAGNVTLEQRLDDGRWLRIMERKMADGHIVGFRVDITELKQATEAAYATNAALAAQQERLQSILQGTDVGTWEWNVQTGVCVFNDRWASMLGYSLAELEPGDIRVWRRLIQHDDLERCNFLLQEHFAGHTAFYEAEVSMVHKDGHWVSVLTRGKVSSWTDDGKPLRMAGTHMDITGRKAAEVALAQTTSTLQSVLDSAVEVGIIATDLQRVVRIFNKGAENLLGYRAEEMVGKRTTSILFDLPQIALVGEEMELRLGRKPTTDEVFWEVANSKDQSEWTLVRKDGSRFAANMLFSPMQSPGGELTGFLGLVYDITRQKETEDALRQTMRLAEQSSVAKSQFLANMSHEIRTPMNAILGMLKLLHSTPLTERQRDYTQKTEGAAKALLGLLNDILDFSKVEAGKMQLDPQPFAVSDLLGDLSVILSSNLGAKPVDLVFDLDPALPSVLVGDALRLKQVLINLAGNAVKFTDAGQVTVGLQQLERSAFSVRLQFSVEDTGIGIAPENQARIFQAFTQAEASTTRRFGGTGLGLVISTRLIRLMGAELQLKSVLGQGTTFSFAIELPLPDKAGAPDAALRNDSKSEYKVLLVDDNERALAAMVRMLEPLGWVVTTAASGAEAVRMVQEGYAAKHPPFDALLVDNGMPGMDGWQTLRAIARTYGATADPLRILLSNQGREVLTGHTEREQEWLDGFLVKPLTAAMLARAVSQPRGQAATAVHHQVGAAAARIDGMRILLVEDNLINQQVATELLQALGGDITVAADGQQGLDALANAQPLFDVVLMDLQMPVMDGLTATRILRKNPAWRNLPVVAMTANAMASDREACLEAGMNDHVGKPFDLQVLVARLVELTGWVAKPAKPSQDAGLPVAREASLSWPAEIDVETALARMGGNRGLLARSIRAYLQESNGWLARVNAQSLAGQWADLARDLHAFKGLSATIGVPSLQAAAAAAEQWVKAHGSSATAVEMPQWKALTQSVDELLEPLRPLLGSVADQLDGGAAANKNSAANGSAGSSVPLSLPHRQSLQSLLLLLQASDMQCMEVHASLEQDLRDALGSRLDALDAAMAELDFALAAVECEALTTIL